MASGTKTVPSSEHNQHLTYVSSDRLQSSCEQRISKIFRAIFFDENGKLLFKTTENLKEHLITTQFNNELNKLLLSGEEAFPRSPNINEPYKFVLNSNGVRTLVTLINSKKNDPEWKNLYINLTLFSNPYSIYRQHLQDEVKRTSNLKPVFHYKNPLYNPDCKNTQSYTNSRKSLTGVDRFQFNEIIQFCLNTVIYDENDKKTYKSIFEQPNEVEKFSNEITKLRNIQAQSFFKRKAYPHLGNLFFNNFINDLNNELEQLYGFPLCITDLFIERASEGSPSSPIKNPKHEKLKPESAKYDITEKGLLFLVLFLKKNKNWENISIDLDVFNPPSTGFSIFFKALPFLDNVSEIKFVNHTLSESDAKLFIEAIKVRALDEKNKPQSRDDLMFFSDESSTSSKTLLFSANNSKNSNPFLDTKNSNNINPFLSTNNSSSNCPNPFLNNIDANSTNPFLSTATPFVFDPEPSSTSEKSKNKQSIKKFDELPTINTPIIPFINPNDNSVSKRFALYARYQGENNSLIQTLFDDSYLDHIQYLGDLLIEKLNGTYEERTKNDNPNKRSSRKSADELLS